MDLVIVIGSLFVTTFPGHSRADWEEMREGNAHVLTQSKVQRGRVRTKVCGSDSTAVLIQCLDLGQKVCNWNEGRCPACTQLGRQTAGIWFG